jgi:hypothetical protein
MASLEPAKAESGLTRALFRVRYQLGAWFGWDDAARQLPIPGCTETTLRQRLPADLRGSATGLDLSQASFTPLYRTGSEWAAELSNGTVHAVLHLAWVEQGKDRYRGQMGVYVKPRGKPGATYMALIRPFRHLIVYPALIRQFDGLQHGAALGDAHAPLVRHIGAPNRRICAGSGPAIGRHRARSKSAIGSDCQPAFDHDV